MIPTAKAAIRTKRPLSPVLARAGAVVPEAEEPAAGALVPFDAGGLGTRPAVVGGADFVPPTAGADPLAVGVVAGAGSSQDSLSFDFKRSARSEGTRLGPVDWVVGMGICARGATPAGRVTPTGPVQPFWSGLLSVATSAPSSLAFVLYSRATL